MSRFRINIFYGVAFILSIVLIGYIWLIFLPSFQHVSRYESIRTIALIVTILLLVSAIIQLYLSIRIETPKTRPGQTRWTKTVGQLFGL